MPCDPVAAGPPAAGHFGGKQKTLALLDPAVNLGSRFLTRESASGEPFAAASLGQMHWRHKREGTDPGPSRAKEFQVFHGVRSSCWKRKLRARRSRCDNQRN